MPSPLYNNATLAAQEAKRKFGVTVEKPQPEPADVPAYGADPLEEAKRSLASADRLATENDTARLLNIEPALAGLRAAQRNPLRNITEPLAMGGKTLSAMSLPAGFINPLAGAATFTLGSAAEVPDLLRRQFAPDAGEEAPGALEYGTTALGALPVAGAVAKGLRAAPAVEAAGGSILQGDEAVLDALKRATMRGKWERATVAPSGMDLAPAYNPNEALGVTREIAAKTGKSLAGVLKSSGATPAEQEALMKLSTSGVSGAASRLAEDAALGQEADLFSGRYGDVGPYADEVNRAIRAPKRPIPNVPPKSVFRQMADEGAFSGDRTTGSFVPEYQGRPIGLASLTADDWAKLGDLNGVMTGLRRAGVRVK